VCSSWPKTFTAGYARRASPKGPYTGGVRTIELDVGHARYPIVIGAGLLHNDEWLAEHIPGRSALIVTDTTVAPLYLAPLRAALADRPLASCVLPDGEAHKTLATMGWVIDALVGNKMNRDGTVIALGGGVIGDIAGFAAACYQRGIGFTQVPTTLLAQVDSSVGGKTGVNHPGGKNLIGAFHQPNLVIADTETLATLPTRELSAGLAETIKYGCIWDPVFFNWLEANIQALIARDSAALAYAIGRSCEIKALVVGQDERENGLRAILNFGHTFGHAIEAATGYGEYLHGEAIAIGMIVAADFSARLGFIERAAEERIRELLSRAQLPVLAPKIGAVRAAELMQMDKKVQDGVIRLVLLEKMGRAIVTSDYSRKILDATLEDHFG
jgi:3-dehydroquinate synthase